MKCFFKPFLKSFVCVLGCGAVTPALAAVVIVPSEGEVSLPIHAKAGSLLQLPGSVKVISPSQHFDIVDVASDLDPASGAKVDVRLFQVRPVQGARADSVTFLLGDGRSVKTQLLPTDGAEKYYDLVFPSPPKQLKRAAFLQPEISLMTAMIRDEAGSYARQIRDASVSLSGFDGLSARLIRLFAGSDLLGFTIEVRNTLPVPVHLDVRRLGLAHAGDPAEKAILLHSDTDSLLPCPLLSSRGCSARIFIVARNVSLSGLRLQPRTSADGSASLPPFMRSDEALAGGGAP